MCVTLMLSACMEVRIVKIEFIKDHQDIRPNRNKIIPKGKVLTVTGELADQYIELGVAKLLDEPTSSNKKLLTKKRISLFSWFINLNTSNQIGIVVLVLAIPGAILAVLELGDRYNKLESVEEATLSQTEQPENFDDFLTRFSRDTAFQISRVRFPHEQEIIDPHEGGGASLVYDDSTDWVMHVNLAYLNEYQDGIELDYQQDTVWNGSTEAIIQQRGDFSAPNTQWHVDYKFELINNKWFLTSSVDLGY